MAVRPFVLVVVLICHGFAFATTTAQPTPPSAYLPHAPIVINGNEDLVPDNGVRRGSGTAEDPFVIEGWFFTSPPYPLKEGAIRILNVSAHLVVQDNRFMFSMVGADGHACMVLVQDSENVSLVSNRVELNWNGFCIWRSVTIRVEGNLFRGVTMDWSWLNVFAVVFDDVDGSSIVRNDISTATPATRGYLAGIALYRSNGNVVEANVLTWNSLAGAIHVSSFSEYNHVKGNIVESDSGTGIQVGSSNNTISNNQLADVRIGISLGNHRELPVGVVVEDNSLLRTAVAFAGRCTQCEIAYNLIDRSEFPIFVGSGSVLHHNLVRDIDYIVVYDMTAHNNSFPAAGYEIHGNENVDLRHNWWGGPDGPQVPAYGSPQLSPWLDHEPLGIGPRV